MKIRKINYKTKRQNALKVRLEAFDKKIADHQKRLAEIMNNPYYNNINNK
jgi:uncharacterized protein YeeX (DUF496 family)